MKKTKNSSRGFTLLLAALAASIALVLGTSIFEIATKQVLLSAIGRDSQFAFYAADTAAECAQYWDYRYSYFATTIPATAPGNNPTCNGVQIKGTGPDPRPFDEHQPPPSEYSIRFQYDFNKYCAIVTVLKCQCDSAQPSCITNLDECHPRSSSLYQTLVHADGFNTSCATVPTNQNALQRSVELRY
jgi:hypothetical protein